jgi:hypothetical protein
MQRATVHPFEHAGLGKAPFRYVGVEVQDLCYGEAILNREEYTRTGISITTAPGGSCAYCGTYIRRMFNVESADGQRFHVGCECVNKTDDQRLIRQVEAAAQKLDEAKREAKKESVRRALDTLLADERTREKLAALPHPRGLRDLTLLDYAEWMRDRAGDAGRARAMKLISRQL